MEHQYPGAISGDENMLAELMLPDQVHNRKEDWTIFFLHKDTSEEEEATEGDGAEKEAATEDDAEGADGEQSITDVGSDANTAEAGGEEEEEDAEGGEGPPLIYVLNLVNTKHDASAKRCVRTLSEPMTCCSNPHFWQRCSSKSNGDLYAASVSSHLQGTETLQLPPGNRGDLVQKLTEIEATFVISPRGVFQIAFPGDFRTSIQRS